MSFSHLITSSSGLSCIMQLRVSAPFPFSFSLVLFLFLFTSEVRPLRVNDVSDQFKKKKVMIKNFKSGKKEWRTFFST